MSYQVLARRWRPQTFEQMVGQEHVLRALVNAFGRNRLHHAYLLTGTRGVGKTTLARLMAKCLNCERGVSASPCGECSACREIADGRFVDLIEVDAASRTKVEDTRELLENVQYAPTRGRFKVYLIDEVHMLSAHSFNALLKTLEEPPPHVKFLLATTDPQKLPATVLSRCLQFHLKNLSSEQIATHLARVLDEEKVEYDEPALWELGRAAEGSMRDALSLADQAIAHGGGAVRAGEVAEMLGCVDRELLRSLVDAVLAADAAAALGAVESLAGHAADFERTLVDFLGVLHRIALAQSVPSAVDNHYGDRQQVLEWAGRAAPEDVQLYYQIGLNCRRDMAYAPDPRSGLEMTLLRMLAFRPEGAVAGADAPAAVSVRPASRARSIPAREAAVSSKKPEAAAAAVSAVAAQEPPRSSSRRARAAEAELPRALEDIGAQNWSAVLGKLEIGGVARTIAAHCVPERVQDQTLFLLLEEETGIMYNPQCDERIAAALSAHFDTPCRVSIRGGKPAHETPAARRAREAAERQALAVETMESDPNVKLLLETFSGRLHRDSIRTSSVDANAEENAEVSR